MDEERHPPPPPPSWFDGLPAWTRVIGILGLPTFFLMIYIARDLGMISSPLQSLPAIERALTAHEVRTIENDREQTRLLRQICRNIAKSELGAQACER